MCHTHNTTTNSALVKDNLSSLNNEWQFSKNLHSDHCTSEDNMHVCTHKHSDVSRVCISIRVCVKQ